MIIKLRKLLTAPKVKYAIGIFMGLFVIAFGFVMLFKHGAFYQNYWFGVVCTPIVLIIGILALYISIFKPSKIWGIEEDIKKKKRKK